MSRRTKIVIAAVILLLLALGAWWLLSRRTTVQELVNAPSANVNIPQGGLNVNNSFGANVNAAPAPTAPEPTPPPPDSSASLKRLASAFAERYGSYSTLGDFENQTDLYPVMSDAFASRTRTAVANLRSQPQPSEYFGVTTRAIASSMDALDEDRGTGVVTVTTQRRETDAAGAETVKYQDIRITFIKDGNEWKADSAKWQ